MSKIQDLARQLRYAMIVEEAKQSAPSHLFDKYLYLRSIMILNLPKTMMMEVMNKDELWVLDIISQFQLSIIGTPIKFFDMLKGIESFKNDILSSNRGELKVFISYLEAELYFMNGLGLSRKGCYLKSMAYLRKAIDLYLSIDFPAQAACAYSNLYISANHICDKDVAQDAINHLRKLSEEYSDQAPFIKHLLLRNLAYFDFEDNRYDDAIIKFNEAMLTIQGEQRTDDELSCLSYILYIYIILKDSIKVNQIYREFSINKLYLVDDNNIFVKRIKLLFSFYDRDEDYRLKECQNLINLEPVTGVMLYQIAMEGLIRSQSYAKAVEIYLLGVHNSKIKEIYLNMYDFRKYGIIAYYKTGKRSEAQILATGLLLDLESRNLFNKKMCLIKLFQEHKIPLVLPEQNDKIIIHPMNEKRVIIDNVNHSLIYNKIIISLEKKPIIEKAITVVAETKLISLQDLFEKIFLQKYNPQIHSSRINSILLRTKNLIPGISLITRRNNSIEINPNLKVELVHNCNAVVEMKKEDNLNEKELCL